MNDPSRRALGDTVTVVVPTYNRAATLRETLESLIAQTLHCRIVVVDDGSEDDTEGVCREFASHVDYIRHTDRVGLFANWNRAVAEARTEFVAVFHDDDVYESTIVERETALLIARPEMVMVHTGCRFIDDHGREFDRFTGAWPTEIPGDSLRRALAGRFACPVAAPSVMLRRYALVEVGGFAEHLRVCGDIVAWIALGALGSVGYIDEALVGIRARGRYANEHAAPDWTIIEEHLRVAETSQLEIHGSVGGAYRARRDAYLVQSVLRGLFATSQGEMSPVVRRYGSWPIRALAAVVPDLSRLTPILERGRPLARTGLAALGRVSRRSPAGGRVAASRREMLVSMWLRLHDEVRGEKTWQARREHADEATLDGRSEQAG